MKSDETLATEVRVRNLRKGPQQGREREVENIDLGVALRDRKQKPKSFLPIGLHKADTSGML